MAVTPRSSPLIAADDPRTIPAQKRLLRLVLRAGGQRALARSLGVDPAALNKFIKRGFVPRDHAACRALGIPRSCWKASPGETKRPPHPEPTLVRRWRSLPKDYRRTVMQRAVEDHKKG